MKNISATRNLLLLGAVALGLALGGRVAFLDPFAMPILMVITTVSMSGFAWREFRRPLLLARPLAVGVILNQFLLGGAMLACAWALVDDPLLRAGFVLVAAAPPGIAIIPFTRLCAGDMTLSTVGLVGGFAATLVLAPLLTAALLGDGLITPWHLAPALIQLLVAPFLAARMIIRAGLAHRVSRWHGTVVNWGFAAIVLAAVGVNREIFLERHDILLRAGGAAAASVFGPALLLGALFSRPDVDRGRRASLVLLGTMKMTAFSTAIGLELIGKTASVPGVLVTVSNIALLILAPHWLGKRD